MRVLRGGLMLIGVLALALAGARPLRAQDQGVDFWNLGEQQIAGASWSFSGDFAISAGAWESVTVSNYGYCWAGPNDPRAGTAHAGAVYWFTELTPQPPTPGGVTYTGTLTPGRGGDVSGTVTISGGDSPDTPTHVEVALRGAGLSDLQGNRLQVCLLGST